MKSEAAELMRLVREKRPLVHHMTNYVTVNDCANVTLCAGGSPVMSEAPDEVEEMAGHADALVLNIGTLTDRMLNSMLIAGKAANAKGIPVILDPVGVGATRYRMNAVRKIMDEIKVTIIKGNPGEIGALAGAGGRVRGVDSGGLDGDPVETCKSLSKKTGAVVVMTGAVDIITDGNRIAVVNNGHEMMTSVSGTGCMAGSVIGCFAGCGGDPLVASAAAMAVFCISGYKAAKRTKGPGTFIANLLDELACLSPGEVIPLANIRLL